MADVYVTQERHIDNAADKVYNCISDFNNHHPQILPSAFSEFKVEEGGTGAGTVISFRMTAGRRSRIYRSKVEEPQPGRVLTESDTLSSAVTTFSVLPEDGGCRVKIETKWHGAGGIGGFFERLFAPKVLSKIYAEELNNLDSYSRSISTN